MLNRWQKTIVDAQGNIQPYAALMIRRESDQALVTVYKDREGTQAYPMGQVTANSMGYAYFYAPADLYRITSATPAIDWRDVDIGAAAAQQIAQQALDNALPTYETLLDMQADTGQDVPTLGRVVNDIDPDNNGYYVWDGVSWDRSSYQPASDADVQARLRRDQNLADLDDAATARDNLGLGSAALEDSSNFALSATKVEGADGLAGGGDLSTDRIITLSGQTKYDLDQIYAQIRRAEYGDGPYPVFDQVFGANARFLDPRITLTRPGDSYRIVNGVLRKYGVDEPCLTGDGWSVRPAGTNLVGADIAGANWSNAGPNRLTMGPVAQFAGFSLRQATVDVGAPAGAYVQWVPQISISPGRVTLSVYIRHDAPGWAHVTLRDDSKSAYAYAFVDLAAGVVGSAAGNPSLGLTLVDATLEPLNDGVWRLDLVIETDGTQIRPYLYGQVAGNGDISSEGLVGNVWYAAVQVNQGDPIPYIPTTDSAVTRPADSASILGDAFASIWNPMEGAIVVDVETALRTPASRWPVVFTVSDGTTANRLWFYRNPSGETLKIIGISAGHPGIAESSIPAPLNVRVGLRWNSAGDIAVDTNGVKQAEFPAAMNMSAMSRFNFGGASGFGQASVPAVFRRLTIFNRRPSDAMMEALTS